MGSGKAGPAPLPAREGGHCMKPSSRGMGKWQGVLCTSDPKKEPREVRKESPPGRSQAALGWLYPTVCPALAGVLAVEKASPQQMPRGKVLCKLRKHEAGPFT